MNGDETHRMSAQNHHSKARAIAAINRDHQQGRVFIPPFFSNRSSTTDYTDQHGWISREFIRDYP
jgi:hypothetical protein